MSNYCVYIHTAPNGKVYVGMTGRNPLKRWAGGAGYFQNEHFSNAIKKYGWGNIRHEIVADGLSKEDACELERSLIAKFRSNLCEYGYNRSIGGDAPNLGSVRSQASREKTSRANKGRVLSAESRKHISEGKKGRSNGRTGQLGAKCPKSGTLMQIDETTGEVICIFYGYAEMQRKTGYAQTPVKEVTAGRRKRAYGYLWEYQKGR